MPVAAIKPTARADAMSQLACPFRIHCMAVRAHIIIFHRTLITRHI
jgi:hypothetical protein